MRSRLPGSMLITATLLLLGVVALASRPGAQGTAISVPSPAWISVAADTITQTLLILLAVAALVATGLNIWAAFPLPSGRPRPRPLRAQVTAYLYFGAAICILVLLRGRLPRPRLGPHSSSGGGFGFGTAGAPPVNQGLTWVSVLAAIVILLIAGAMFLRWWRSAGGVRSPRRELTGAQSRDRIVLAIGGSLDALRAEPDPRRAVIAAYARLEVELGAIRRARFPSEAPLEYLARILIDFKAGADPLRRLTDLFEWAKFSHHPVDHAMKEDAIRALEHVRAEISAVPTQVPA